MASAGRILIMPRGVYDSTVKYEMLDLVAHNGTSWLAKKTSIGIEPSEANGMYWHNMFDMNIVNNLEATEEGGVLDARQGKVLSDKVEKLNEYVAFMITSPKEAGVINYIRQNCYKAGNRVHIEFSATSTQQMLNSEAWALIPSEYAPHESTGCTGIFTFAGDNGSVINTCGCSVLPPSDELIYGMVYHQSTEDILANNYVGFMFDYYI